MSKYPIIAIMLACLAVAFPYGLDQRWRLVFYCGLAGALWLLQLKYKVKFISLLCFLFLAGASGSGIFLQYNPIWLLTSMLFLLIAWDLDHFSSILHPYSKDQDSKKDLLALFQSHLKRLGIVVILGWVLGVVALNAQIPLNLAGALIMGILVLLTFRKFVDFIRRESSQEID